MPHKRLCACGSMVLAIIFVFRFLRSPSAKIETQKKIKYRSAEGWIADCVSPVNDSDRMDNLEDRFQGSNAADWICILDSIVVAAILFGVGHLPAAAGIWPLTRLVIVRIIALNALLGMAFGFIYWRSGLEYAMLAHFCADIVVHGISGS